MSIKKIFHSMSYVELIIWLCVLIYLEPAESFENEYNNWGVTQINISKTVFEWTIDNYNSTQFMSSDVIESPLFFNSNRDQRWQLWIWPAYSSSDIMVRLILKENNVNKNPYITYKFGLKDSDGNITYINTDKGTYFALGGYVNKLFDIKKFHHILNSYKPLDKITIVIELVEKHGFINYTGNCNRSKSNLSTQSSHRDNFEALLEEESFSDVKIVIDSYEFPVHRAVLAALSPVFSNIFKKDLNKSVINIVNVNPIIFKEVLRYIYTGKVKNIDKIANEILPVADKYEIKELVELCEEALCQNLNEENAMDTLSLADMFNSEYLKSAASNFIAAHALKISNSKRFQAMEISQPHPFLKIFRLMVNKYKSST